MSLKHWEQVWASAIDEIAKLLEEEKNLSTDDNAAADKSAVERWAGLYLRYLQVLRLLEYVHQHIVQPQAQGAVWRGIEASAGQLLQVWQALVAANGVDAIHLEPLLADKGLTPGDLEVPVPAALREKRAAKLAAHEAAISTAVQAAASAKEGAQAAEDTSSTVATASVVPSTAAVFPVSCAAAAQCQTAGSQPLKHTAQPSAPRNTAWKAAMQTTMDCSPEDRARAAERFLRGWRGRQVANQLRLEERSFLGMISAASAAGVEGAGPPPGGNLEGAAQRRQAHRAAEYAVLCAEAAEAVAREEGESMHQEEQEKLYVWMGQHSDPASGAWPAALDDSDSPAGAGSGMRGSVVEGSGQPGAAGQAGKSTAARGPVKSSAPRSTRAIDSEKASGPPGPAAASPCSFEKELLAVVREHKVWQKRQAAEVAAPQEVAQAVLSGLPLPRRGSSSDGVDTGLLRAEVRPRVQGAVRQQVQAAAAAAAAQLPKPSQPSRGSETSKKAAAPPAPGKKPGAAASKAPKDLLGGRQAESILPELAAQGLAVPCPAVTLSDYVGTGWMVPPAQPEKPPTQKKVRVGGKAANAAAQAAAPLLAYPELSMAQARQLVASCCALPLGCSSLHGRAAWPTTALLYGPPGTGKTLLAMAVAHTAGAALFDLSPATTAGNYPGKDGDAMVHLVFAAAKVAAPSVVYIDEVEKIFITDKMRSAALAPPGGEPPCRIRRQLVAEAAALTPASGVLVLCTSSQPQACVLGDEAELVSFFKLLVHLPLPAETSRRRLLQEFSERELIWWGSDEGRSAAALTLAAHLTQDFTPAQLKQAVAEAAGRRRAALNTSSSSSSEAGWQRGRSGACSMMDCLLEVLPGLPPVSAAEQEALRAWTARAHAPQQAQQQTTETRGKQEQQGAKVRTPGER